MQINVVCYTDKKHGYQDLTNDYNFVKQKALIMASHYILAQLTIN